MLLKAQKGDILSIENHQKENLGRRFFWIYQRLQTPMLWLEKDQFQKAQKQTISLGHSHACYGEFSESHFAAGKIRKYL